MAVGRFLCVALPFALTVGSLVLLLIATLGGVTNTGLYLYQVNLKNLSIDPLDIPKLSFSKRGLSIELDGPAPAPVLAARAPHVEWHDARLLAERQGGFPGTLTGGSNGNGDNNVTAAELGLGDLYDVSLWGYCRTDQDGKRECTKAQFNWAESTVNSTAEQLQTLASTAAGREIKLPSAVTDAIRAYATLSRWTGIAFIIALVCLGVELLFGIFANCSRAFGCVTFIVAGITSLAVLAAASLATAMSVLVVGTVEGVARWYGVKSYFNTVFLSLIWLSAALALGAGFFWMFTICCCAPDHSSRKNKAKRSTADAEKLLPTGAYQPLHEPGTPGYYNNAAAPQYGAPRYPSGAPRSDIAYEPYSHRS